MATITATAAASNVPAKYAINRNITRVVQYAFTAAQSAGDVVQMLRVPSGAVITDLVLWTDAFAGGNITVTVGDGNSTTRYIGSASSSSSLAAALRISQTGFGYSYSAEDTIDISITTVTTATAAGVVKLGVTYTNDNQ